MARFDGMMLWTDDFLADTTGLDRAEIGSYLLLLMAAWRSKTGTLPDDDRLLARMARCSPAQWRRTRPLMLRFFEIVNQEWQQGRLMREREKAERRSDLAANAANNLWVTRKKSSADFGYNALESHDKADASASSEQSERNATSTKTKEEESKSTPLKPPQGGASVHSLFPEASPAPKRSASINGYRADFDVFWQLYPKKERKKEAEEAYAKARHHGVPAEIILRGLRRVVGTKERQYFQEPHRWIKGERWNDEPAPEPEVIGKGGLG